MSTRAGIIRNAVNKVPKLGLSTDDGVNALTADSNSDVHGLFDVSVAPPLPASKSLYKDWYIYLPAAAAATDNVRIIGSFDPVSQGWRIAGTDYGTAPTNDAAGRYLVLKDHPLTWNRALNYALTDLLSFPRFDEFSPVSDTRRIYAIASAPISVTDLTRLSQIWDVEFHDETETANEEDWKSWADGQRTLRPFEDEGTLYLDFGRGRAPGTSEQFRMISTVPYAALTDETTTSNAEEEWAALATLVTMADWLADPDNPSDPWTEAGKRFQPLYEDRRRAVLGKFAFRQVIRTQERHGGVRVAGRAGR